MAAKQDAESQAILDELLAAKKRFNFASMEENVLKYWKSIDAFQTSLKLSEGRPLYTFYDGPPFATGRPHYGHILAGTIKDTVTRYAHQTGHYVSRRFGWDCHGLPVEHEIDKKLGIKSRDDVMEMGIAAYNEECRGIVTRYTGEWEKVVNRLGRWIDFENDYKTMEPWFMESVWWVFKTIFEKKLVYRSYKVMPYSTACNTPLSNFESGLDYRDVVDPAATVSFPLVDDPEVNLLAWTTTPWTLPSNLALCVNNKMDYVKIKDAATGKIYILAEARLCELYKKGAKAKGDAKKGHVARPFHSCILLLQLRACFSPDRQRPCACADTKNWTSSLVRTWLARSTRLCSRTFSSLPNRHSASFRTTTSRPIVVPALCTKHQLLAKTITVFASRTTSSTRSLKFLALLTPTGASRIRSKTSWVATSKKRTTTFAPFSRQMGAS